MVECETMLKDYIVYYNVFFPHFTILQCQIMRHKIVEKNIILVVVIYLMYFFLYVAMVTRVSKKATLPKIFLSKLCKGTFEKKP